MSSPTTPPQPPMTGLTPQQRLVLSRYALRCALHPQQSVEPDPEVQELLALQQAQRAQHQEAVSPASTQAQTRRATQPVHASTNSLEGIQSDELKIQPESAYTLSSTTEDAAHVSRAAAPRPPRSGLRLLLETAYAVGSNLVAVWWQRHPVNLTLQASGPALSAYGRRKPFQLLAMAAAAGAVLVLLRPWRSRRARRWAHLAVWRQIFAIGPLHWWQGTLRALLSRQTER